MGLPVNATIDGRYVLTQEEAGVNSKIIITRLSDSSQQQLVMKASWLRMFDGLIPGYIDQSVMGMLCDELFAG